MNRHDKETVVADLTQRLTDSAGVYLADFTGIPVKEMTAMRRRFRESGARFVVVKNTLAQRACHNAAIADLDDVLTGPTGLVFVDEDPVSAAKVIADFQKELDNRPEVKGGVVDGHRVTAADVKKLANLPGREQLLGQLAGAFQAPMAAFVGALDGMLYQFAGVLEALRAEREGAA